MQNLNESVQLPDRRFDLLTVGELLIDMISEQYDDAVNSSMYHRVMGGSAANVAINAKKLGMNTVVASAVGRDGLGDYLLQSVAKEGIPTHCIQRVESATSMVVVTKSRTEPAPIFYRGADHQLAYTQPLQEAVAQSKMIHFTCWPVSMPASRATMEKVLEQARANGALIGFDPNYHPSIWNKGEDGGAYVRSLVRHADIIKPSEDDSRRLFGEDTAENQLGKWLGLGARWVILTLGKDGAIVSNGKETVRLDSVAQEVVDATGAGDAFWAGFYAGVANDLTIWEAARLGMEVSACKLKHLGPVRSYPPVQQLIDKIRSGGKKT